MNIIDCTGAVSGARVAIVAARFNQFIVSELVDGAVDALTRAGLDMDQQWLAWVPGAYELPVTAKKLAATGRYDAVIALGAVIRGGTPHFEYVAGECASGLMKVGLKHQLPVVFGVLTTDTIDQALERAGTGEGNKGYDSATTALEMIETLRAIEQLGEPA